MKTPICPTCSCSLVRLGVGKDAAVAYCYNGEDYLFCCRGCVDIFITDPEKYLAEIKGLAVCPTCLGEKPLERTIRMEHDAVVLHFCRCPHCLKEFAKNPEYYINRLEDSTILKPAGQEEGLTRWREKL